MGRRSEGHIPKGSAVHFTTSYNCLREMHTYSNLTDGKTKVLSNLAIEEIQGPDQDLKPQSQVPPMSLPRGSILPGSIQGPPLYVLGPWDCADSQARGGLA